MKKVALVSHSSSLRGAERMILNLAILLRDRGEFIPILLIPNLEGPLIHAAKQQNVRYFLYEPAPWHIYKSPIGDFSRKFCRSYQSLRNILVENPCDAVLANTMVSIAPVNVAVDLDLPLVVWIHGVIDSSMLDLHANLSHFFNQWIITAASAKMVVSKWTGEYFRTFYNLKNYNVVYNWYKSENQHHDTHRKYESRKFVCLASHEDIKGMDVLVNAAIELKKRGLQFEVDLFGDGPQRQFLEQKVTSSNLSDKIRFHGFVSDNRDFFYDKLGLISTSYVDSFGLTLIEAMAHKTPVIATRAGGPEEIVKDGLTGFLIDRGDYVSLADKMQFLLENSAKAREMGNAAYEDFQENFSEHVVSNTVHSMFHQTITGFSGYSEPIKLQSQFLHSLLNEISQTMADSNSNVGSSRTELAVSNQQPNVLPRSSLRLQAGLIYRISPSKNILSGLKILVMADKPAEALRLKVEIFSCNMELLRTSEAVVPVFFVQTWIGFEFLPIHNSNNRSLILKISSFGGSGVTIHVFEINDYQNKIVRILKRIIGFAGLPNYGNQLCFVEV
ncbi:MAG: glycosyltransferase family 4 protein [Bacteroidia bacterium]|nr:glycosyltransferase family 4 protein [Bacteroidia bacterium]